MKAHFFVVLVVGILFAVLLLIAAIKTPMTFDEPLHIASGYSKFVLQDFRMNTEQPLLAQYLMGVAVSFSGPNLNISHESWVKKELITFSQRFFFSDNQNPEELLFLGRLPSVLFSLVLLVVVYFFAVSLAGKTAGVVASILVAVEPSILAHGSLATTDMPFTALFVLTLFLCIKYVECPSRKHLVTFALVFAFWQLTKYSAIVLSPVFLFVLICVPVWQKRISFKKSCSHVFFIVFIVWFVVCSAYLFRGVGVPVGIAMQQDSYLGAQYSPDTVLAALPSWVVYKIPSPLPYHYVKGIGFVLFEGKSHVKNKLFNGYSTSGFRSYYFFAFLFKTSIPLLLIMLITKYAFFVKKPVQTELILLLCIAWLFMVFSLTTKQLGIRYILPVYPLVVLLSVRVFALKNRVLHTLLWVLVFLSVLNGVSSLPKPLAYYNEFIGSENGWKVFADSNTDWGQDVDVVKQYVRETNGTNTTLRVLTVQDLKYYGIGLPRTGNTCSAGMHIASAYQVYINGATWLANYTPMKQLGTSVFVFNITEDMCAQKSH